MYKFKEEKLLQAAAKDIIFALQIAIGAWCSWLAYLHGVQAVARSSRAAPTKPSQQCEGFCLHFFWISKLC